MNPGDVVTLTVGNAVGGEKRGSHPAVVVRNFGPAVLVVPLTDAGKSRLPTHHLIPSFSSGTQTKDALATCEHAISVHPSRLSARPGAAPVSQADLQGIRSALRVAVALAPVPKSPPSPPTMGRGAFVQVDFGQGQAPEPSGVLWALILSNDTGNYYGRHYLVAPLAGSVPVGAVSLAACPPTSAPGQVDVGLLRVVDQGRLVQPKNMTAALPADVAVAEQAIQAIIQ